MARAGVVTAVLESFLKWSRNHSFWYASTSGGCCAEEVLQAQGCRYDLERFGAIPQTDPKQADLLIITGAISYKAMSEIKAIYEQMPHPKHVIAIGSCAANGGAFSPDVSYCVLPGVAHALPVDVYVPGCPPRPEAVMNGLIALQERIHGVGRTLE